MSFPPTYMRVVETLLELYNVHKRPIKSKEIANRLGMNEGTVRNIMVALKAMNLVD
jgi:Predicted transcriptional regulator, contains C-terminal CBS domains